MNIAFYFSGKGTRVRKIIKNESYHIKNLKLLFCDNLKNEDLRTELSGKTFISIDYYGLSEDKATRNEILSGRLLTELTNNKIDYLFCWGDHILKGELLKKYKNRIINFHPSILPMFPGRFSVDQAVKNNSFLVGNTAHFIDEGIDSGPVIMQSVMHSSNYSQNMDYDRILDNQIPMFKQINYWLENRKLQVNVDSVTILDTNYSKVSFFPQLDPKFL